ncbi:MAG: ribokinase [Proteobacteria bacterium]|nr:ribokinase [Pseudomonadota bacterium]
MSVCVIGSLNLDIVCRVAELPAPGETVAGLGVDRLPGGKGGNQAVAAARAGAPTTMIAAIGQDEAGQIMLASLKDAGVDAGRVIALPDHPTGQAFIWVSAAGENSIVVAGGANAFLTPDRVTDLAGQAVLLGQLETPVATLRAAFARAGDALRILNAAPALDEGRALLPLTDILVVNETELARYANLAAVPETEADIAAAARGLIDREDQTVIVTLGKAGAMAVTSAGVQRVAGRLARVVDTTGAGDCFCGVLAARLSQGAPLAEAMAWANTAAGLSTQKPGAAPSMPTRTEIEAAL